MPVEIKLSTTFCAVPAFIRVEPAISSRPVSTGTGYLADVSSAAPRLLATPMVMAWHTPACCSAATVNGVVPLAETAITTSHGESRAALACLIASATSSSAPFGARGKCAFPADDDETEPLLGPGESRHQIRSILHGDPAQGAGANIDQASAITERLACGICRSGDSRNRAPYSRDRGELALPHRFHR
jgi:hypothetical protein